jgi:hypothetical protein
LFDPIEEAFDQVICPVEMATKADGVLAVDVRGVCWPKRLLIYERLDPVSIVATIRQQYRSRPAGSTEAERLAARLMGLFAIALGLPRSYFDGKIDHHFAVLSSIFYPVRNVPPRPEQLRAGAHTDYGSLTILAPTDAPGGPPITAKSANGSTFLTSQELA